MGKTYDTVSSGARGFGRWLKRIWRTATRASNPVYFLVQVLITIVGGILLANDGANYAAVGTGLISAGIAGMIAFLYVLLQEGRLERQRALDSAGLRSIFATRSVSIKGEYDERLRDAHRQIDILGFGLNSLRQDFGDSFHIWAQKCKVRILLLDPDGPIGSKGYADARDVEEGDNEGTIRKEVEQFLAETASLRSVNSAFQVRLYHTLPSVNIFRIDNSMFFGPYLLKQPSRNTPTILLSDGFVFDRLADHYDKLWSDEFSRPAP